MTCTNKIILVRHVPLINNVKIRWLVGLVIFFAAFAVISAYSKTNIPWTDVLLLAFFCWIPSVFLTDKYMHKYPQRYLSYLSFSHLKAFCVMGILIVLLKQIVCLPGFSSLELASGFIIFSLLDAFVSYPHKEKEICRGDTRIILQTMSGTMPKSIDLEMIEKIEIQTDILKKYILSGVAPDFAIFINNHLPHASNGHKNIIVVDEMTSDLETMKTPNNLHALFCTTRMNDVKRLNLFLEQIARRLSMGGYFIMTYTPLENVYAAMRKKNGKIGYAIAYAFHFLWFRALRKIPLLDKAYFSTLLSWLDRAHLAIVKRRNRALSKAEMWGRLAFWGLDVIAESTGDDVKCIIARRLSEPNPNRIPSYYPIVRLAKVGLDGEVLRIHKVRSMYAFSEFIQNRIFQDQGLTETGKFKNDFRLTEYGKFIRRYWIDELPQLYDWLKGDIKLVGMRATSPHYLTLYPSEIYDLYVQVKPGLISPIFDEATSDFKQIAQVEYDYLKRYVKNPFKADFSCLVKTLTDILFRGVRSK